MTNEALFIRLRAISNNATQRAIESVGRQIQTDADAHMGKLVEEIFIAHLRTDATRFDTNETQTQADEQQPINKQLEAVARVLEGKSPEIVVD